MREWHYDVVQYETAKAREIIYQEITDLAAALEKSGNKTAALDLLCDYNIFCIAWRDAANALRTTAPRIADCRDQAVK